MFRNSVKFEDEEEDKARANKAHTFYSYAGRRRLNRIWIEQNLSQEVLFSTWIAGQSEALVRERVTDYLYAFLQTT
jgi:hypothetical protein